MQPLYRNQSLTPDFLQTNNLQQPLLSSIFNLIAQIIQHFTCSCFSCYFHVSKRTWDSKINALDSTEKYENLEEVEHTNQHSKQGLMFGLKMNAAFIKSFCFSKFPYKLSMKAIGPWTYCLFHQNLLTEVRKALLDKWTTSMNFPFPCFNLLHYTCQWNTLSLVSFVKYLRSNISEEQFEKGEVCGWSNNCIARSN